MRHRRKDFFATGSTVARRLLSPSIPESREVVAGFCLATPFEERREGIRPARGPGPLGF